MTKSASRKLDSYNEALYANKIRKDVMKYEPKRVHCFLVDFPNLKPFILQSIDKPKYVNGKWGDIEIEVLDLIGPSSSQIIFGLTNPPNYAHVFDTRTFFEKLQGKPIFSFKINSLDPTGHDVEQWTINVKKIKSIDFGRYDYANDGLAVVRIVIEPKTCVLNY